MILQSQIVWLTLFLSVTGELSVGFVHGFSFRDNRQIQGMSGRGRSRFMVDTPFDASFYDDEYSNNPFGDSSDEGSLAVPLDTKLVLGINKYSHDTTICAADAVTGEVLFAMAKERLSRKKHDGGNVATLVDKCLEQLELDMDSIQKVVVNNHHHRVFSVESNIDHMEWEEGLGINGGAEVGYTDEENLFTSVPEKYEMSHHLAHAYSAAAQCPFDKGMIVIMDGIKETYRTMRPL